MIRREGEAFTFLGVVHLLPLPGAPRAGPGIGEVSRRALADADALAEGGASGMIVENLGDAPFARVAVDAHVVAMMSVIVAEIRARHPALLLGVNVLRNDAAAALAIAAATGADFVRVNVLAGAVVADQGIVEGNAHRWLRYRREIEAERVSIAADVRVKHAAPLGARPLVDEAADLVHRAGASAVIVTGKATGASADPADADAVRPVLAGAPLWVGSGVSLASAPTWRARADGAVVGTALHADGRLEAPVDPARVVAMARALGL